jgi:hypothetical protein
MEDRNFIFAYVPKVACTNWKSLLRYMAGVDDWLNTKLAHDKKNGGLRYLNLNEANDAALLKSDNIKKFAMIRDPYSRILSAYLNKVESRLPLTSDTGNANHDYFCNVTLKIDDFRKKHLDLNSYPNITFEVFLLWIKFGKDWESKDEHWATQVTLLRYPQVKFDIIGRFENIDQDSTQILNQMGCSKAFPSQSDVKFAPTKASEKMDDYYSDVERGLVTNLFSADFSAFGY